MWACFLGLLFGFLIKSSNLFINSFLLGFVAKDDISSKYLDLLIAALILCLNLLGILSKALDKIPNKLRHKINAAISKSRYFDEISSFATNPKRNELINKLDDLIRNPNNNPRKHAHKIHEIHTQWQLLDLSSKLA